MLWHIVQATAAFETGRRIRPLPDRPLPRDLRQEESRQTGGDTSFPLVALGDSESRDDLRATRRKNASRPPPSIPRSSETGSTSDRLAVILP